MEVTSTHICSYKGVLVKIYQTKNGEYFMDFDTEVMSISEKEFNKIKGYVQEQSEGERSKTKTV